ncbi:Uncharacterized protein ALO83_04075 [Pseudomonas cannabina pv. alisalensis]|uniref:DUF2946 domain-containing protein n=3 Tax=Pseudomonas syringae group TaxID=136849 RepID=A0A3M3RF49_PSECA|nr:Uncharacterized protein ALO83_04075 [Pseudomonas cannabina pv. alisalensis]RMN81095.1 hypothetical protein ALQ53_04615 [Pseudomonas cannabina]RMN95033.1 hypothetical protein ALQ51_05366 [Pseudomonas cannabina]
MIFHIWVDPGFVVFKPARFDVNLVAMKLSLPNRSLVAWTLYFCVLFNVFACGLGHGQMSGFALNGIGGEFCSVSGGKAPIASADFSDQSPSGWAGSLVCPICSAVTLSIVFLLGLIWLLRIVQKPRLGRELRCKAPPRYSWPSANPRASPLI